MVKRTMNEMITNFNDTVSKMDISINDKMTLLGMITAIGYEYQKAEYAIEELQKSNVAEVKHGKLEYDTDGLPKCSHCDEIALQRIMLHFPVNQYFSQFVHSNFCPRCGARMDGE